jgi:uncharacterized membrane protein SpoIIM required for sporulation
VSVADRDGFVAARRGRWRRLERVLQHGPAGAVEWSVLASDYRSLCADLSRARHLGLPDDIQGYLDELAGRAHNQLYGQAVPGATLGRGLLRTVAAEFPQEVRRQWVFFSLALVLFYGPFLVGFVGSLIDPAFAARILPPAQLEEVERMYSSDLGRSAGGDVTMAGFYVWNNVGIAFRCFATGAFAGLGSVFYLVYNGLLIGTIGGYLAAVGLGGNLLQFVAGHTAWELTGVVVAGTAGLRLGWAMIVTEGRTRVGSLREAGPSLYRLVLGAAALLLVAALIEGFWSASPMPGPVKLVFGVVQIAIVTAWLVLGGRREDG